MFVCLVEEKRIKSKVLWWNVYRLIAGAAERGAAAAKDEAKKYFNIELFKNEADQSEGHVTGKTR